MPTHARMHQQQHQQQNQTVPHSPRVLLLVDFISRLDFPGAELVAGPAAAAARASAKLKERLSGEGVATIYANDNWGRWQSDFRSLVAECLAGSGASAEIARLLQPGAHDITVLKPRHSAFYGSPLELLLDEMGAQELVICGVSTDMCVQLTAADAFLREFRCWVPADCSAAQSAQQHEASLHYMATVLKCDTRPSTEPPG